MAKRSVSASDRNSVDPGLANLLAFAEVIAHRDSSCRSPIASILVSEIRYVVQIELRAYENVLRDGNLKAGSQMYLEMIRTAER